MFVILGKAVCDCSSEILTAQGISISPKHCQDKFVKVTSNLFYALGLYVLQFAPGINGLFFALFFSLSIFL